jgi:hypothetical protein
MISFGLICPQGHEFEGWFRSSSDFDDQIAAHEVSCPICQSVEISKAIMAPNVATSSKQSDVQEIQTQLYKMAQKVRSHVEANFDYVGRDFPDEARKIQSGEAEDRGIYGEATRQEVKELTEEGVEVAPMPELPPAKTSKKVN